MEKWGWKNKGWNIYKKDSAFQAQRWIFLFNFSSNGKKFYGWKCKIKSQIKKVVGDQGNFAGFMGMHLRFVGGIFFFLSETYFSLLLEIQWSARVLWQQRHKIFYKSMTSKQYKPIWNFKDFYILTPHFPRRGANEILFLLLRNFNKILWALLCCFWLQCSFNVKGF